MDAICYVCNKQSTDISHQNLTQLKSQHTETPIGELIKTLLAAFNSVRNIDDESNHICVECLLQFDDYDWMRQQTIEQEAKLRHLLLTTELKLKNMKNTPIQIEENGIEGSNHNGFVFAVELGNVAEISESQPLSSHPTSSSHSSTSSSMSIRTRNFIPACQRNCQRTIVPITKPKDAVWLNGNDMLVSTTTTTTKTTANDKMILEYERPSLSYVCLIAMALKNSRTGSLLVSEMCSFMSEHFPYFKTALHDWKRSVRNSLSSNKVFMKTGLQASSTDTRGRYFWAMDPFKVAKIDEEIQGWMCKFESNVDAAMAIPENLPALMRGELKHGSLIDHFTKLDDIIDFEAENELESTSSGVHSEESVQSDCSNDVFGMFGEVIVQRSQAESHYSDIQPARKRTRHDIEFSTASNTQFNETSLKYLRPPFTYACLIAMALKNSHTGSLLTTEICSFISEHFPYFRTATEDWKRNVRNFLSSHANFIKMQHKTIDGVLTKKWLWTINPLQLNGMLENIRQLSQFTERNMMAVPENFPSLLRGEMKHGGFHESRPQSNDIEESAPRHPKPAFENMCLIALALKNSWTGSLQATDIFSFIGKHFPYFRTAPKVWKSSVQNILRLNNHFVKVECKSIVDGVFHTKCMWKMNPLKMSEINARVKLQSYKNPTLIHDAMAAPENLPALIRGDLKHDSWNDCSTNLNSIVIDDSDFENDLIGSVIDSEENMPAELFDDACDMLDGINIEDLLQFQFQDTPCIEDGQTELYNSDSLPTGNCAVLDSDLDTDSAETFQTV